MLPLCILFTGHLKLSTSFCIRFVMFHYPNNHFMLSDQCLIFFSSKNKWFCVYDLNIMFNLSCDLLSCRCIPEHICQYIQMFLLLMANLISCKWPILILISQDTANYFVVVVIVSILSFNWLGIPCKLLLDI